MRILDTKNKGITLVALVITIILLLILAGITISQLTGSGLFENARLAEEMQIEAEAKEKLAMLLAEYRIEKELNNKTLLQFLQEKAELQNIDEIKDNEDGTITVEISGYSIIIDENKLSIEQVLQETEFEKLTKGKAKFKYDSQTGYVSKAEVAIDIDESVKAYTIQYKVGNQQDSNWTNYAEGTTFEVINNGNIYGRILNLETNEVGYNFILEINNIDEIAPKEATIEFDKTTASTGATIKATITQYDDEIGIDITNCKYIINTSQESIKVDSTSWDSATTLESNPQTIDIIKTTGGTYYVHVLSADLAGNKIETVSSGIVFKQKVTLLNTQFFGRNGNSSFSGWTQYTANNTVNSSATAFDTGYTGTVYISKNAKVNFDSIDKLTLYIQNLSMETYNGVVKGNLYLGVTESPTSSTFIKEQHISWSSNVAGSKTIVLDTSDIQGEYYIKILMTTSTGRAHINNFVTVTITSE